MNARKVMAVTLATAMVVGSSMTVLAGDTSGSATASGSLEGYVDTSVITVDMPTSATYSFLLDPQGLIYATSGASLTDVDQDDIEEGATVLFKNTTTTDSGDVTTYSSSSDAITLVNNCLVDLDVSVTATLTNYDDIAVSESSTFTSSDAEVYFALVSGTTTKAITETTEGEGEDAVTTASATLTGSLDAVDMSNFEVKYADGSYSYELSDSFEASDDQTYEFSLTGASNADGDWSELSDAAPVVTVVWTVTERTEAAPSIATTEYTMTSGSAVEITVDLGAGDLAATGIASITYTNSSGAIKTLDTSNYSFDATTGVLTLSESYISGVISAGVTSRAYTITFDDDAATAVSVTLKTA